MVSCVRLRITPNIMWFQAKRRLKENECKADGQLPLLDKSFDDCSAELSADELQELLQLAVGTPWEEIEPDLLNVLVGRSDNENYDDDDDAIDVLYGYSGQDEEEEDAIISLFFNLYHSHGVADTDLLMSLAYLHREQQQSEEDGRADFSEETKDGTDYYEKHTDSVRTVAALLVDPGASYNAKLACLKVLLFLARKNSTSCAAFVSNPQQAADGDDECEESLRQVLAFCIAPRAEVAEIADETTLLWELRAVCLHLQEQTAADPPPSAPSSRNTSAVSASTKKRRNADPWEYVKEYLFETDAVLLKDLDVLHAAYASGLRNAVVLASVGYLRIEELTCGDRDDYYFKHNEAVHHVATFCMDHAEPQSSKVACLQCLQRSGYLLTTDTPMESGLDLTELMFFDKALAFCTDPSAYTESFLIRNEEEDHFLLLLWELRAVCLHILQQQEERHERVMEAVATVAESILAGAMAIETGLKQTTAAVTAGMDAGSQYVVRHTVPAESAWLQTDPKAAVVTLTYSGSVKRVTEQAREATSRTVRSIKDVSTQHIMLAAEQGNRWIMSQKPEHRTAMQAAGRVALATLGAASVIGEAVVTCTGAVAQGAAQASSVVVQHKYGNTAGQVVRDVGDTAGNLLRIARNVALLTGQSATRAMKVVAKHAGKVHVGKSNRKNYVDESHISAPIGEIPSGELESELERASDMTVNPCPTQSTQSDCVMKQCAGPASPLELSMAKEVADDIRRLDQSSLPVSDEADCTGSDLSAIKDVPVLIRGDMRTTLPSVATILFSTQRLE